MIVSFSASVGVPGPAGIPGQAKTQTASSVVTKGKVVITQNNQVAPFSAALLQNVIGGVALQTATAAGSSVPVQTFGVVDPTIVNVGAGLACAVGIASDGTPVRIYDATNVAGLAILGDCDTNGTIFVRPRLETAFKVSDFGFISGQVNDTAARYLIEAIRAKAVGGLIEFPAGDFYFNQAFGPIPGGVTIRGAGHPAAFSANRGTRLIFNGPGTGILFNSAGTAGNASHGGFVERVAVCGNLNTGHLAPMVNTPLNSRVWAGRSPIPTLSGTPTAAHVWEIVIDSATTFHWSKDGATYTLGATIAPTVLLADGVSVNFPSGTYVAGDSFTGQSVQNINECGIEIIGDVDVNIFACITHAFKYQISFDGCETCGVRLHNCQSTGTDLIGYQDMVTDLGDNSAVAMRIGSFKFTIAGSANGILIDQIEFNNSRFGTWHQDGQNHTVRNCGSEMPGAFVWISGAKNIFIEDFQGEGNTYGIYIHKTGGGSSTYGIRLAGVSAPHRPIYLDGTVIVSGMMVDTCELLQDPGLYAITGAQYIQGIDYRPTNRVNDYTKIADGYCGPIGAVYGQSINHAKLPAALLDGKLEAYGFPFLLHRVDDNLVYRVAGGPSAQYDGYQEDYTQQISGSSGLAGARVGKSVNRASLAQSALAANYGNLSIINNGSTYVYARVTATRFDDSTKTAFWRIRQACHREGAVLTLLGTPTVLESDTTLEVGFTQPILVADAANSRIQVTLQGHALAPSTWAFELEGIGTGR